MGNCIWIILLLCCIGKQGGCSMGLENNRCCEEEKCHNPAVCCQRHSENCVEREPDCRLTATPFAPFAPECDECDRECSRDCDKPHACDLS